MTTRILAVLLLMLLVGGAAVSAQDRPEAPGNLRAPTPAITSCPLDLICVEYQGAILEVDPACGPVAAFVVSESLARTVNLAGITESYGVIGVVLVAAGDTYIVAGEFSGPATEALAGVRFGDVGCIDWGSDDE